MVEVISKAVGGRPGTMHLGKLLLVGLGAGQRHHWWARQLVTIVALAVDQFLPGMGLRSSPLDANALAGKRRRLDPALPEALLLEHGVQGEARVQAVGLRMGVKGRWASRAQQKTLVKYFLSSRDWFRHAQSVSIAVDASRVGGRQTMKGV
eukprot:2030191-Lingulodinium_polyedra.AAC.1